MGRITKSLVDAMQPGDIISDGELPGFRVRCGKHRKVYSVQRRIGRKVITRTIGKHGIYTPDSARREARRLLLSLSQGVDPLVKKRREANLHTLTFGKLLDLYLQRRLTDRTRKDVRLGVQKHLAPWMNKPANDITRSMVVATFNEVRQHGETQCALIFRYARAIFNHGIAMNRDDKTGESDIRQNPVNVLKEQKLLPRPRRRKTYIKPTQLKAWLDALEKTHKDHPTFCDYLVFTLLTGCRRSESARLKWADVDLLDKSVNFRNTKNGTDFHLPTGRYVTGLLEKRREIVPGEHEYVFPSVRGEGPIYDPRDAMLAITARSGVKFTLHDLRRTFITVAESLELSPYTLKRLLNHSTDDSDVTAGYIVSSVERLRGAMQQIENLIIECWRPA